MMAQKESARVLAHPDAQRTVKQWLLDAFSLPHGRGAVKGLWCRAGAALAVIVAITALEPLFFAEMKLLPLLIITLCAMVFAVLARRAPGGMPYVRENHQ